ncbi:PP2C family protein-serine/threonine phosphatase [Streptomyces sp. ODS28]|uniref:PP2C family protein-serine/threonine phosphatase n=1 Tax=Streptomyces sp. ODS28 TaxID=3136688 RepID=UPI0031EABC20
MRKNVPVIGRNAPWFARWIPALLLALGVLCRVFFPAPEMTGGPFFSAAPLVAAPFCTQRCTAVIGVLASVFFGALLALDGDQSPLGDAMRTLTIVTVAVLALGINRALRRGDAELASARGIAEAAQRAVLPLPPSRIGALEFGARYQAAQTDARIGGDLYAVQETPYGTRMLVGDVRGKGMGAVEAVVIVLGAFREAAEQEWTLEGLTARLEWALHREGERRRGLDQFEGFTTAVLAEVPADRPDTLRIVNRGHPPPLLIEGDGTVRSLDPTGYALPLGMPELGVWPDRADEVTFSVGSQLLLYTDGLSEARSHLDGSFYEPAERLAGLRFDTADSLLDAVMADVLAYTGGGGTTDDLALLVARRSGSVLHEKPRTGFAGGSAAAFGRLPRSGAPGGEAPEGDGVPKGDGVPRGEGAPRGSGAPSGDGAPRGTGSDQG